MFRRIAKIDVSSLDISNNVTASFITPSNEKVMSFTIDDFGNIYYTTDINNGGVDTARLLKHTGGLHSMLPRVSWVGLDGYLYYNSGGIRRVSVSGDGTVTEVQYSSYGPSFNYIFNLNNRIYGIGPYHALELDNLAGVPRTKDVSDFDLQSVNLAGASATHYYLLGSPSSEAGKALIRVDPTNDSHVTIVGPNLYDFYHMNVSADNVVTFNALRLSDGAKVIGQIAADGVITVVNETLNVEVFSLERIQ
jgi:hypothetical protein